MVSRLAASIAPSETFAIDQKAKQLAAQGRSIINFSIGEPDFQTPERVKEATITAVKGNRTKYAPVAGIQELKQAVCDKLVQENKLEYQPENIVVSNGAKQSLYNALLAIANSGDEIIVIAPYWSTYAEQVKLCRAKPVIVQSNDFSLPLGEIKISKRTKAIIINSPNNPTGAVYSKKQLEELGELAVKHQIHIISDEIYEKIIYDEQHYSIGSFSEDIKKLTITINGLSKSYAMTGYRVGYAAAAKELAQAMQKIQSQTTSGINTMAQYAALEAMKTPPSKDMVAEFRKRRDIIYAHLKQIDGIAVDLPKGAFYIFPDVSKLLSGRTIQEFSEYLLEKANIAVVPGPAFGRTANIRFSYALAAEKIEEGISRMQEALK
ncbi:pyridoxal phosphate-dependent aminotransferase [Candidatus Woesearchaeota archaeon]|nr:pyridoxal phosphate-dependent aminotransferase [Candidatus Woesearchaeota archaeon]